MSEINRTDAGEALTDLILAVFRVNNLTVTWGDRLVSSLGLTSARWQVLGAIVASVRPQPVAWLARDLGANRQNIQRITNDLAKEGLIVFEVNPHHKRASLVVLTDKGRDVFDQAIRLYNPRVNALTEDQEAEEIMTALKVVNALKAKLEGSLDDEERAG